MPLPQLVYRSAFFQVVVVVLLFGMGLPAFASQSQLVSYPRSLAFGKVVAGQSKTLPMRLTNTGTSTVTVSRVGVSVPVFTVGQFAPPVTIAPHQSVNLSVTFTPTSAGSVSGIVTFISDAANSTLNVQATGKGINDWALQANPTSLSFGSVPVGNNSTLPMTLINAGSSSQTISLGEVGGSGYSVSGVVLPLTLAAGQSFTFNVTFAPKSAGPSLGNIRATSPNSPVLDIPLSGAGGAAGTLTLSPPAMNF